MLQHCRLSLGPAVTAGASICVNFKSLGPQDFPSSFIWPPPQEAVAEDRAHGASRSLTGSSEALPSTASCSEYYSHRRSPFSVLRSRQRCVGRCASGVLPMSYDTVVTPRAGSGSRRLAVCGHQLCCCSALFYTAAPPYSSPFPAPHSKSAASSSSAEERVVRVRDDFLWALKLASVERLLNTTVGEGLYRQLLGGMETTATVVLTCNDLLAAAGRHPEDSTAEASSAASQVSPPATSTYVARLLLSADEDNRIKWLQEESAAMSYHDYYSRAPSLRALFVMWSIHQQQQQHVHATAMGFGAEYELSRSDVMGPGPRLSTPVTAQAPKSHVPPPTMEDIQHILLRMKKGKVEMTMSDIAAIAAMGAASAVPGTSMPSDEFFDVIVRDLQPRQLAEALKPQSSTPPSSVHGSGASCDEALVLQHVLLLLLLLRYFSPENAEVMPGFTATSPPPCGSSFTKPSTQDSDHSKLPPSTAAFKAASEVIQLRRCLTAPQEGDDKASRGLPCSPTPPSAAREALLTLCNEVLKHAYRLAERLQIEATSPNLPEFTTWLLREMTTSAVCEHHFKRLVDRSMTEALVALEKSGLVNKYSIDLRVLVCQVLPLLESCGNEDLYTAVLRDVMSALEEKVRRDRHAFDQEDMLYLAELGTKLFASGSTGGTARGYGLFDQTARGQMEELYVMDGSPWALCVSSYRSLKEMVQGIIGDQRRLKQQVREQLRQLSSSSTISAVMTGGADAEGCRPACSDGNDTPVLSSCFPSGSKDSSVARGEAAADTSPGSAVSETTNEKDPGKPNTAAPSNVASAPAASSPRILVSATLRQRFLILVEELVKAQVDESSHHSERPIVVSTELFAFVTQHVPVPNIQDEYRRKIFLLVNVAEAPETTHRRLAERREERSASEDGKVYRNRRRRRVRGDTAASGITEEEGVEDTHAGPDSETANVGSDPHGGANEIPAELRFLVSSLPLTLSPWASVMILREVLAESAGRNPRYTYVLNAAIDLQLPMSTTRSRIATTLNMWRFLNTQAHKLSLKESVMMKQRCAWNLPMAYVLSSYWSLLTWLILASILTLNVVGIDFESQIVANSLFRMFAPWEEMCVPPTSEANGETWSTQAAVDLASDYFEHAEIADRRREEHQLISTDVLLSSASYLILGHDDQRRPLTVIPIGSDCTATGEERIAEEYAAATSVLRELSLHAPFPFFVDIERSLPIEYVETRIAERIRRVSFNNTWFLPRMIIRTFPLGRRYTEHKLVHHTCTQANLTRRRITFLLYIHDGVPVTPQFIQGLNDSHLSRHANLVLVVHESSLLKGGTTPAILTKISLSGTASGTSSTIASAAAGMIDSVLPSDLRDLSLSPIAASKALHMRVLPYCRQYYTSDGNVIPSLQGDEGTGYLEGGNSSTHRPRWERALGLVRRLCQRLETDSSAAPLSARLPLFASAFSSCRVSLLRRRERQCREAEEKAAANQQSQRGGYRMSAAETWVKWWRHAVSSVTSVKTRMIRLCCDGVLDEEEKDNCVRPRKSHHVSRE
ncbi:hypothetical protein JKF63_00598 [Porcisia hertigi]|uniref:Uncharacterized protein n=1 Tax=Porcisia hertigi TaxID=2761500 RepID=A0A836L723_9TRYP|nr:hypothetical protein JKF63_00598 [Porcisia hertigi]